MLRNLPISHHPSNHPILKNPDPTKKRTKMLVYVSIK